MEAADKGSGDNGFIFCSYVRSGSESYVRSGSEDVRLSG
jgi:hypothetical protein